MRRYELSNASHIALFGPICSGKLALATAARPQAKIINAQDYRLSDEALNDELLGSCGSLIYVHSRPLSARIPPLSEQVLSHLQSINECVIITNAKLELPGFCAQFLPYLDFEEFCSLKSPKIGDFLLAGARADSLLHCGEDERALAYQQLLIARIGRARFTVLATVCEHIHQRISVAALHRAQRCICGKNDFYAHVDDLLSQGLIFALDDGGKKRFYAADFALKNALCAQKNFAASFANLIACELRAIWPDLCCGSGADFYSRKAGVAVWAQPFFDAQFAPLKARKFCKIAADLGCQDALVLGLNARFSAEFGRARFIAMELERFLLCKDEPL